MYGPKPPAARRLAHPLADGGLVARMKSADAGPAAFGSRGLSQLRDLIPKMEAMGYKQQPQSFAKGGMIRGPGTGTSDSIPDEMAPGTYILPADTTKKLALDDKKVPVRVSNGEYELPPEQVQAVGAAVLDAIKGVTHAPKSLSARGLQSPQDEQFFATGGSVRDPEELRKMIPQVEAMGYAQSPAAAPAPVASTPTEAKDPLDGGAVFGMFPQLAGGKRTTYAMDDKLRTGVQATGPSTFAQATPTEKTIIGGGDGRRMNAEQDPRSLTATGMGAVAGVPGAAPSITPQTDVQRGGGNVPAVAPPSPNPAAPSPAATGDEIAPGVYKHGRGQYSDNAAGMGMPANFTGQPSAQNMAAADALAGRQIPAGFQPAGVQTSAGFQPAGITAPTVRNSTNDWAARNNLRNMEVSAKSITANGGRFDQSGRGDSPEVAAYKAALANDFALQQAQPNMDQTAMRENAAITREGMQQAGATTRTGMTEQGANAREAGRNALTRGELELKREAAGFQTRAAAQQEQLRNTLIDPKATPEQRKQAQEYLQALAVSGKEPSPQYKSHVMPAIRNADGSTTEGGVYQENTRTGEGRWVKPQGDGQAQQGALPKVATPQDLAALKSGTRFVDPNGVERIKK